MIAVAGQHDGAHVFWQRLDARTQLLNQGVGQRVALGRTVEFDDGDIAIAFAFHFKHGNALKTLVGAALGLFSLEAGPYWSAVKPVALTIGSQKS